MGVEPHLAPSEVREDGACGEDKVFSLKADKTLASAQPLPTGGIEADLSGSSAADSHPVPVEDDPLTGAQHPPRLRRQADVKIVRIHATIVP